MHASGAKPSHATQLQLLGGGRPKWHRLKSYRPIDWKHDSASLAVDRPRFSRG